MDKKEKEALLSFLAARFFAYNLLKRAFLEEPSKEFLELLKKDELLDFFPGKEEDDVDKGSKLAAQYLKESSIEDRLLGDLAVDYASLFIATEKRGKKERAQGDRDNAPPYESVYASEKPLIFQEETIKVRRE